MNIVRAIADANLFRPFLAGSGGDLSSWAMWQNALRALYGLPLPLDSQRAAVRACIGRKIKTLRPDGYTAALFLTGRRSGKSRMAAIISAYEAVLAGHEKQLAAGETGVVACISPTRAQSRIVRNYLRAIFAGPVLAGEVVAETVGGFQLRNGIEIEVVAGDHKLVRGRTLVACVLDEICFFNFAEEARLKSDIELVRGVQPALATTGGKLIAISSPYGRRGWAFGQWKKHFGNAEAAHLVWQSESRRMNPTLLQSVVDDALAEDRAAASSEYLAQWRDDVCEFLPRSLIESLVVRDRQELLPRPNIHYQGFADLSGGRSDDAALCIAHRDGAKVVLDKLCRYRPPCDPRAVITKMAEELKRYGVRRVVGDSYGAEFVSGGFKAEGFSYVKADKPKAALYLEALPRMCSAEVELLDHPKLIDQLASLERRTRAGGKDIVDHAPGSHDDLANVASGVMYLCGQRRIVLGSYFDIPEDDVDANRRKLMDMVALQRGAA